MAKPEERHRIRKEQGHSRTDFSAYDRALIKCAQKDTPVTFTLATGDVIKSARVVSVDKFQIEIEWAGDSPARADYSTSTEWLNKSMIVRTKIGS